MLKHVQHDEKYSMPGLFSILSGYFFVSLLLLVSAYLAGHVILRCMPFNFPNGKYTSVFFKLLTGSAVIVIFSSLAFTLGRSIYCLFILPVLFFFTEKRFSKLPEKIPVSSIKNDLAVLPGILIIFFIAYLWQASVILNTSQFPKIENDSVFYAEISKCLVTTGWENTFSNYNLTGKNYHYPTPYHYFDLWLNGICARTFRLNYSLCLYLVTYTFFTSLFMLGILALTERFLKIRWFHFAMAFLLMFVSGLYVSENLLELQNYNAQMEGMNELFGNKLQAAYCFALAVVFLFTNKNMKTAFCVLLCLPFISISLAPAVYGGILLYCIISLLRKAENKIFLVRLILYVIVCLVFVELFYSLQKKNNLNYRLAHSVFEYTDFKQPDYHHLKYFTIELFLKLWMQPALFFLNYLPFILIPVVLYVKTKENVFSNLTSLLVCIWFAGLVAFGSLYRMDDAHQFYTNSLILLHVFFAYCFVELIRHIQNTKNTTTIILAGLFISASGFNCFNSWSSLKNQDHFPMRFSEKYMEEVNRECASFTSETKGAIFCDTVFYKNLLISLPLEYYALPYIHNPDVHIPFNLSSTHEIFQGNRYQVEKSLSLNPFNQYLSAKRNDGIPLEKLRLKFISENKIRYLVCPKNMNINIPEELDIQKIITDEVSGQRFVVLNTAN